MVSRYTALIIKNNPENITVGVGGNKGIGFMGWIHLDTGSHKGPRALLNDQGGHKTKRKAKKAMQKVVTDIQSMTIEEIMYEPEKEKRVLTPRRVGITYVRTLLEKFRKTKEKE